MAETQHIITIATQKEWSDWVIPSASGIVSFFALLFAVYRDVILKWWRKPELHVSSGKGHPYLTVSPFYTNNQTISEKAYYYHLAVINDGKDAAQKCIAELSEIWTEHRNERGKYRKRNNYIPTSLKWALEDQAPIIAHKQTKYIDIGCLLEQCGNVLDQPTNMWIYFSQPVPPGVVKELEAGQKHRLLITIYGDNFEPAGDNWFELDIPLTWRDDILNCENSDIKYQSIANQFCLKKSQRPKTSELYKE